MLPERLQAFEIHERRDRVTDSTKDTVQYRAVPCVPQAAEIKHRSTCGILRKALRMKAWQPSQRDTVDTVRYSRTCFASWSPVRPCTP